VYVYFFKNAIKLVSTAARQLIVIPPACISSQCTFDDFPKLAARDVKSCTLSETILLLLHFLICLSVGLLNSIDRTCQMEFEAGQLLKVVACSDQWFLARKADDRRHPCQNE
jgi:hypothetical protein